jgi:hypothetical protein
MNLIGCLDAPSQGEYWLNGKNVSKWTTMSWPVFGTGSWLCLSDVQPAGAGDGLHNVTAANLRRHPGREAAQRWPNLP